MLIFLLGISITLNVVLGIVSLFIYRYSLKGVKNRIENAFINSFANDTIDIDSIRSGFNDN